MHTSAGRPPVLANPRAERVKKVAGLAGRSARLRSGLILVEGPQSVRELLRFRASTVRDVYISHEAEARDPELLSLALGATRWVHPMTDEVARAMSADAQGVVAVASAEAVERVLPELGEQGMVVVLAQGRDPGNVGTIIRTADAFGAVAVVTVAGTVEVTAPKVLRSAAGSVFHLPVVDFPTFAAARAALVGAGVALLGTSGSVQAVDLPELVAAAAGIDGEPGGGPLAGPHAWVMGNEARGLSDVEMSACDVLVRIPMTGHAESLNVATAAALCMYASQSVRNH